jgi:hypothetical protein
MLLLYAIPIGILLGLAAGGRLAPLGAVRIRWWPLALGGLLFQLVLFSPPVAAVVGAMGPVLYVGSTAVVLVALLANLSQPGFMIILGGALMNLAVISLNGGQMPAAPEAMFAAHGVAGVPTPHFSNSIIAAEGTPLWFLGDVFVLPRPFPMANVFSAGDVLIGVGGVWFVAQTMRRAIKPAATPRAIGSRPTAGSLNA